MGLKMTADIDVVIPARNSEATLGSCLRSVQMQVIPESWSMRIVLVDDNSDDATRELCDSILHQITNFEVITNESRKGRARTLNAGFEAGTGECVMVLDSDCAMQTPQALERHLQNLRNGADISISPVATYGKGFWAQYQARAAERRHEKARWLGPWVLTTACMVARRKTIEHIGGFDESFVAYGFEDRDLLLRAHSNGYRLMLAEASPIIHEGETSMPEIVQKLKESAQWSAPVMVSRHPDAYKSMPYARFDLQDKGPVVRTVMKLMGGGIERSATAWENVIESPYIPFGVKELGVKVLSAASYACGSAQRPNRNRTRVDS